MNRIFGLTVWQIIILLIILVFLGMTLGQFLLIIAIVVGKNLWDRHSAAKRTDFENEQSALSTSPTTTTESSVSVEQEELEEKTSPTEEVKNFNAYQLLAQYKIILESIELIDNSKNVGVVVSRIDLMLERLPSLLAYPNNELSEIGINQTTIKDAHSAVINNRTKIINTAIYRAYHDRLLKVSGFQKDTSKLNNIAKFFNEIMNTKNLPQESKDYCNQLLAEYTTDHTSKQIKPYHKDDETSMFCEKTVSSMVKTDNTVNSVIEIIPTEILNLLWFSDGNLKNYDKEKRTVSEIKSGNFTFTLQISGSEDPSAISFELPIGVPLDPAPKLGYFPSYANMTPDERATYLYWLTNIDTPIDISYVFVFYYGLERLLYFDENKYETAFNTILRLRKNHKHPSFLGYSSEALMGCAIAHKRNDLLKIALENNTETISPSKLACMAVLGEVLSTEDIISLASSIGFTNKRYIKMQYPLFFETLNNNLHKKYSTFGFPLTPNLLETHEKCSIPISANISIEERWIKVPNILSNVTFQKELLEMLRKTHEDVKNILKQQRYGKK